MKTTFTVFAAVLATAMSCWSQSNAGKIETGNPGDGVVYTGSHALGPGTNASAPPVYNVINISGKAQLNQLIITNGIYQMTNAWAGPTNSIDFGKNDQYYVSLTAIQITGFTGKSNQFSSPLQFQCDNTSATNWLATIPASVVCYWNGLYTNQLTVTNGTRGFFWFKYSPQGPRTNAVFQQL